MLNFTYMVCIRHTFSTVYTAQSPSSNCVYMYITAIHAVREEKLDKKMRKTWMLEKSESTGI